MPTIIRSTPPPTQPAMMYCIFLEPPLSFGKGFGVDGVDAVIGFGVVGVVVSAKTACTLEILALMALDMLATEL